MYPHVTFSAEFGQFSVKQYTKTTHGSFHRLTPEQFDALYTAFGGEDEPKTMTTAKDKYGPAVTFRTADIDFGGLNVTIFSDVPNK